MDYHSKKVGILGAGQLGKMLIQDASKLGLHIALMDKGNETPAYPICQEYTDGDINNYADVMRFGQDKDIISIEIEGVNVKALYDLEAAGKEVYPQPHILEIIKDKGLQKMYYADNNIPTSDFEIYDDHLDILEAVEAGSLKIPFVQKARTGGYDGRGVQVVRSVDDLSLLLQTPSLCEALVDIDTELSVIIARSPSGEVKAFDVVEMVFHPTANLVDLLFAPSKVDKTIQNKAIDLAKELAESLGIVGLLAVELFLDRRGELFINEVAPRPHNSGHHTIEAAVTSQYSQHIRSILDMPLGDTTLISAAAMVNLLGHPDYTGPVHYKGLDKCLQIEGGSVHLYGKTHTKPNRKMGHATAVSDDVDTAIKNATLMRDSLQIISKQSN